MMANLCHNDLLNSKYWLEEMGRQERITGKLLLDISNNKSRDASTKYKVTSSSDILKRKMRGI